MLWSRACGTAAALRRASIAIETEPEIWLVPVGIIIVTGIMCAQMVIVSYVRMDMHDHVAERKLPNGVSKLGGQAEEGRLYSLLVRPTCFG